MVDYLSIPREISVGLPSGGEENPIRVSRSLIDESRELILEARISSLQLELEMEEVRKLIKRQRRHLQTIEMFSLGDDR